jgi:hypothetical protein
MQSANSLFWEAGCKFWNAGKQWFFAKEDTAIYGRLRAW